MSGPNCSPWSIESTCASELDEVLYRQYVITNTNIHEGKNPHITFKKVGFSLSTPKQEESEAEPLQQFSPEPDYVPLLEVLATVNRYSRWMDELQHWQQRFHHGRPAEQTVYAGVIALSLHDRAAEDGTHLSPDQRGGPGAYR